MLVSFSLHLSSSYIIISLNMILKVLVLCNKESRNKLQKIRSANGSEKDNNSTYH